MIIKRLVLQNFRRFRDLTISFKYKEEEGGGINVLVGSNGAGKSSILDAIFVGLFGLGGRGERRGRRASEVISFNEGNATIILDFLHAGRNYRIKRVISSKGGSEAQLLDLDAKRLVVNGAQKVREKVCEMIGGDENLFTGIFYVRQNEMTRIVEDPKTAANFFVSCLRLDKYDNAIESLKTLKRYVEGKIKEKEEDIKSNEKLIEDAKEKLKKTKEDIFNAERGLLKLRKEKEELEEKLWRLKRISEAINIKKEIEDMEKRVEQLESYIKTLRREESEIIEKINRLKELRRKGVKEEYEKLEKAKIELDEIKGELQKIEGEKNLLKRIIEEGKKRVQKAKDLMKSLEKISEEEINALKGVINRLESFRKRLKEILERIPLKRREIVKKFAKERGIFEEEIKRVEEELEKVKMELDEIKREISNKEGEKGGLEKNLEMLKEEEARCPLCGREFSSADERERILAEYVRKIKEMEEKIGELENKREEMEARRRELEEKRRKLEDLRRDVLRISDYLEGIERGRKILEKYGGEERVKEIIEKYEEFKRLKKEIEDHESKSKRLNEIEEEEKKLMEKRKEVLNELDVASEEEIEGKLKILVWEKNELENLEKEGLERKLEGIKIEEEKIEEDIEGLRKEVEERRGMLETMSRELGEELKNWFGKEKTLKEEIEKCESLLEECKKRIFELNNERGLRTKDCKELEEKIMRLEKECGTLKTYKKKLEELKETVMKLSEAFALIRDEVINRAIGELTDLVNEIFLQFTLKNYRVVLSFGRGDPSQRSFNVSLIDEGGREITDIRGYLSGGELMALALSLRIALATLLDTDLLILDEPTTNLDAENREKLIDLLKEELRKIRQVILVTHDEELAGIADKKFQVTYLPEKRYSIVMLEEVRSHAIS